MKKASLLMVLCALFLMPNLAFAAKTESPVYSFGINNFIKGLKETGGSKLGNVTVGEATYDDEYVKRICTIPFGSDPWNAVTCWVDDATGGIDRIRLRYPLESKSVQSGDTPNVTQGMIMLSRVLALSGLNREEFKGFGDKLVADMQRLAKKNPDAKTFKKSYSVWCALFKQTIVIAVEIDDLGFNYDISAYR